MKTFLTAALLSASLLGSTACLVAMPPVVLKIVGLMPAPPEKPMQPVPVPPPDPRPPSPLPPMPTPEPRLPAKRCEMDRPHRAHDWTDAQGRTHHCDGLTDPKPRALLP